MRDPMPDYSNRCPQGIWSGDMGPCICEGEIHSEIEDTTDE